MQIASDTPIVIIGGGPVGMMLALHLDMLGVPSVILNLEAGPLPYPKGSTHNARTMEHYRRLGLSAQLRALGLPPDYPTDVGYFTRLTQHELARIPMPSEAEKQRQVAQAATTDQVVEPLLRCNQMYIERAVYEHLMTRPHIQALFGWRCLDWTEDASGVTVEIEEIATSSRKTLSCAYLAACDGGQSMSRRKLGISLQGSSMEKQAYLGGTMFTAYLRSANLLDAIPHPRCWQYWTINSQIRSNMVCLNGRDEFLFQSQLGEGDVPDADFMRARLYASLGAEVDVEIIDIGNWTPGQALVAERYGSSRVFLCGDAVHLFTPTGGFGMNTGVDDAVNLAWKLAAAVQGWGGDRLLETYELERRPIGLRNTNMAKILTRRVGKVPVDPSLEEDSAGGAAARSATGEALAGFASEFASLGIQLGARYDGSPIIVADDGEPPVDDTDEYVASSCPGGRTPHFWLADKSSLFDHLGTGFTLLLLDAAAPDVSAMKRAAESLSVPLKVLHLPIPEARRLYGCAMTLVRPDQYVAWRGDALPADCGALLASVTGAV